MWEIKEGASKEKMGEPPQEISLYFKPPFKRTSESFYERKGQILLQGTQVILFSSYYAQSKFRMRKKWGRRKTQKKTGDFRTNRNQIKPRKSLKESF